MSGSIFIVAAPSGAGKSSLVNAVLTQDTGLQLSISHTTRKPRPGEADGREYHFVDLPTFERLHRDGRFLECAEVHGNRYGTSRDWLQQTLDAGRDIMLEIDWQGARQVRKVFPGAIGIFVLPPSLTELERRLRSRGKDSEATIAERMRNARDEIGHAGEFDYVIINKYFDEAKQDLSAIIRSTRLRSGDMLGSLDGKLPDDMAKLIASADRN